MVAMARFVQDHRIRTWLDGNGSFKNIMLVLHKLFEWNYSQNTKLAWNTFNQSVDQKCAPYRRLSADSTLHLTAN